MQLPSNFVIICVCFSILFSVVVIAISLPQQRLTNFFERLGFRGEGDGKLPHCVGGENKSIYLKRIRFKSSIPVDRWKKIQGELELFYRRKIYKIEQSENDIRKIDIYLIETPLPPYIEFKEEWIEKDGARFAIGEGYNGRLVWDADILAHGLVAGSTGSGKTGILRCIAHQAIQKRWNVTILDFKGGGDFTDVEQEAKKYSDLEKSYGPCVISEPKEAHDLLMALTIETKGRLEIFQKVGVSNINEYNESGQGHFVPWLIIIDEAAEVFDVRAKDKAEKEMYSEMDYYLRTLARTSRAAGIHILMGFIRPDANVLDGQIKNNLLWRVCGFFSDPAASRIVLDSDHAVGLPPEIKGRFIIGDEEAQAYYMPIQKSAPEV